MTNSQLPNGLDSVRALRELVVWKLGVDTIG
jgi:hypothetical protein